MHILHLDASIRTTGSVTRELSARLVNEIARLHEATTDYIDLAREAPGHIGQDYVEAMYLPIAEYTDVHRRAVASSDALVARLQAADLLVLGVPMYNFAIPSSLKAFLDQIVRSGLTFSATAEGYEGLLVGKRAIAIIGSGGSYQAPESRAMDFVTPYLKTILGFIGITDVEFVQAGPTLFYGDEARTAALSEAEARLDRLAQASEQ